MTLPLALPFPEIAPEIFAVELFGLRLALRWYALAYVAGLVAAWLWMASLMRRPHLWGPPGPPMTPAQPEAFLTWAVIGVVIGGRLGFVLFYQPAYYAANPGEILAVWQGGMSFHGGFLGVVAATAIFAWRNGIDILRMADAVALVTPPGLMLGRLANFINGELWGRPSDAPWAMVFPDPAAQLCPEGWLGACTRHPSQLYQAGLEGLALALFLAWLVYRRGALRVPGLVMGAFVAGYGAARVLVEGFRQPDAQFLSADNPLGHVLRLGEAGLTMGQILSLPMLAGGIALMLWARARARP